MTYAIIIRDPILATVMSYNIRSTYWSIKFNALAKKFVIYIWCHFLIHPVYLYYFTELSVTPERLITPVNTARDNHYPLIFVVLYH